jgi:hypothetical protein
MMRSKDYGVEVVRAYEFKRVGQIIYPPALVRDRLVKAGLVRRIDGPVVKADGRVIGENARLSVANVNHKKPKLTLR